MTLQERIRNAADRIRQAEVLSERMIWGTPGVDVWRADRFTGTSTFYPVYRMGDLYSHNPLFLIACKGSLKLDPRAAFIASHPDFEYYSGPGSIDEDVRRVGGPLLNLPTLRSPAGFVEAVADALQADISDTEAHHPSTTNLVFVGGKDSLNLLLLRWRNPVVVLSAAPNHALVERFVVENDLDLEVIEIRDEPRPEVLQDEILANACRMSLSHSRWITMILDISRAHGRGIVFWLGQMADAFLTPYWRNLENPAMPRKSRVVRGLSARLGTIRRAADHLVLGEHGAAQRAFFETAWSRVAMWQGAHTSIMRAVTDRVVLSAYHGREMQRALASVDLTRAVTRDLRTDIARRLAGREVWFPSTNPSPEPVLRDPEFSRPPAFVQALDRVRSATGA